MIFKIKIDVYSFLFNLLKINVTNRNYCFWQISKKLRRKTKKDIIPKSEGFLRNINPQIKKIKKPLIINKVVLKIVVVSFYTKFG